MVVQQELMADPVEFVGGDSRLLRFVRPQPGHQPLFGRRRASSR